jgi:hypothetical protein
VLRNQIAVNSTETFLQDQADVIMKFNTGSFRHTLVAGAEAGAKLRHLTVNVSISPPFPKRTCCIRTPASPAPALSRAPASPIRT